MFLLSPVFLVGHISCTCNRARAENDEVQGYKLFIRDHVAFKGASSLYSGVAFILLANQTVPETSFVDLMWPVHFSFIPLSVFVYLVNSKYK